MEFKYVSDKLSFAKITSKYARLKKCYDIKKKLLQKQYEKALYEFDYVSYEKILYNKNKLDIKYIKKVVKIFKPILKNKVTIFLHGSYARNANRWNSDIDLNILYQNKYKKNFWVVEEFIQVLIYKMFDYPGRDKVHNIMLYYPMLDNKKYVINGCEHAILWNEDYFLFKCRSNYEKIYPLILNSAKDPDDLYKWIIDEKRYAEYLYSFKGINKKGKKYIKRLLQDKDADLKIKGQLKYLDNIKLQNIDFRQKEMKVSDLNKRLKINNLKQINSFLMNLRIIIVLNSHKNLALNYKDILESKILKKFYSVKEIQKLIAEYKMVLDRLENLCQKQKINFSSREEKIINLINLNNEYYKLYRTFLKNDLKIIDKINEILNKN